MRIPGFVVLALSLVITAGRASAQTVCVDLCRIPCVKPISFADRWDDATGIPGYMGEGGSRLSPDWRNNAHYDFESFTDANGNGLRDADEPYVDGNANGSHDAELYDPWTTGYTAAKDAGLELVLHPGSTFSPPAPGMYLSVALPPINKGTPSLDPDDYRFAWADCGPTDIEPDDRLQPFAGGLSGTTNQAMRDQIGQDPDAAWDPTTGSITNSDFPLSPRIWFIPVHDPRIPIVGGAPQLAVRKVVAFFAGELTGPAECRGRLLRVEAAGETCGGASAGGFVVMCPVPAPAASWGRVKATYR